MNNLSIYFKKLILDKKATFRWLMSICMVISGTSHFIILDKYIEIIPSTFANPATIVCVSGVLEILGGVGLLIPQISFLTAWGLVLLFITICVASVSIMFDNTAPTNIPNDFWLQVIILPLQFMLILWAWWLSQPDDQPEI